jgi:hypothetical protein
MAINNNFAIEYTLKNPIQYYFANTRYTLNKIGFKSPTGKFIKSDFFALAGTLKEVQSNTEAFIQFKKEIDFEQLQKRFGEFDRLLKYIKFLMEKIDNDIILTKIDIETKLFDIIKNMYWSSTREQEEFLSIDAERTGHSLTIEEYNNFSLEDIIGITKTLKDFFFSKIIL